MVEITADETELERRRRVTRQSYNFLYIARATSHGAHSRHGAFQGQDRPAWWDTFSFPRPLTLASRLASMLISALASIAASCSISACAQQQQRRRRCCLRRRWQACSLTGGRGLSIDSSHAATLLFAARSTHVNPRLRQTFSDLQPRFQCLSC